MPKILNYLLPLLVILSSQLCIAQVNYYRGEVFTAKDSLRGQLTKSRTRRSSDLMDAVDPSSPFYKIKEMDYLKKR